jgi:formiminotetrahydrofolate cyclodeaminase
MPPELAPEAKELLELFAQRVELSNAQLIKDVRDHVDRSIDAFRVEVTTHLTEIKAEQRDTRSRQIAQGEDIASIKTRLVEGDKEINEIKRRVGAVEKTSGESAKGLAYLGGALAVGTALGGAVSAAVTHLMK